MPDKKLVCAVTLNRFVDLAGNVECVDLNDLQPWTTLLVRTANSLYRIVTTLGHDVEVEGGAHFPERTSACLDGATIGGSHLKARCICVGLRLEFLLGNLRIITSPVRTISITPAEDDAADESSCDADEPRDFID